MWWIFLLIDYEYRATSTIFVRDKCGLLVRLKESAWHRHRLSADLENKSDLARQRYYSLQLHSRNSQLFGSILCA